MPGGLDRDRQALRAGEAHRGDDVAGALRAPTMTAGRCRYATLEAGPLRVVALVTGDEDGAPDAAGEGGERTGGGARGRRLRPVWRWCSLISMPRTLAR